MTDVSAAKLLVVDDEAALMRSLRDTLTDQGYAVTGFTNPAEALASLRAGHRYELMLADLAMPGMDGIALLREALRIDDLLVVVIMTGEGTIATAVEAMRSGAYDYILKPFKMGAILPVLRRGLGMRALRMANVHLETSLRERSAELERANRDLDAFTRSASHDLRSPLSGVLGLCALLGDRFGPKLPEQAAQWIERIQGEVERTLTLLDDLMRLSRLGKQALARQAVDMEGLAREVAAERGGLEPGRVIDVRIEGLPPTQGDEGLLRQVFVNLLSNAFKFTRGRERTVIELGSELSEGRVVYFVRDNGVGFDATAAGSVFDAFRRLHGDEQFEGSGVGLSIVRQIVERHGGRIWADSTPGQGARFSFTLSDQASAPAAH